MKTTKFFTGAALGMTSVVVVHGTVVEVKSAFYLAEPDVEQISAAPSTDTGSPPEHTNWITGVTYEIAAPFSSRRGSVLDT